MSAAVNPSKFLRVALPVSAWIEILTHSTKANQQDVALPVSAWIEIYPKPSFTTNKIVALPVSAWIEINLALEHCTGAGRRTPCECMD